MKKITSILLSFIVIKLSIAQNVEVYPTSWFTGMQWNKVQLLLRAEDQEFNKLQVKINYPGISINKVSKFENGKYLAVDIVIAPNTKPGNVPIGFTKGNEKGFAVMWSLKAKRKDTGKGYAQGVTNKDFIYLLMPDRFSNGDESNDRVVGMLDQTLNRDSIYHRHGGDLQGIINHLDYLQSLGVTTVWPTPVLENNMPNRTEHGYAFTNHYKIEPRFGGAEAYKKLGNELHKRGMKLIQDAVYNHIGAKHFLFTDMPSKDWMHQWPAFTQTSYKDQPLFDPYASKKDAKRTVDGWFTREMPDLNQGNSFVANYLIQHALWCVEEFGIDGWRIDTYIYNDLNFMNACNTALLKEFPSITMFGETWVHGVISQSYFTENKLQVPFKSNLQGVTDFQTNLYGIAPALNEKFGWTEGVNKLYSTLAQDVIYKDPNRNVNFLDNHDMSRFFSQMGEDVAKQKMGLQWLLTCRGIPQLYYGTEILMKGYTNPDGWVRLDFAGGWQGDKRNAFTGEGLTVNENEVLALVKKLGTFRKNSTALQTGKFMQYLPQDGLYVYFRYDAKQTIMCIMNTAEKQMDINFKDYAERTDGFTKAIEVISQKEFNNQFSIGSKQMLVLQLQ